MLSPLGEALEVVLVGLSVYEKGSQLLYAHLVGSQLLNAHVVGSQLLNVREVGSRL